MSVFGGQGGQWLSPHSPQLLRGCGTEPSSCVANAQYLRHNAVMRNIQVKDLLREFLHEASFTLGLRRVRRHSLWKISIISYSEQ